LLQEEIKSTKTPKNVSTNSVNNVGNESISEKHNEVDLNKGIQVRISHCNRQREQVLYQARTQIITSNCFAVLSDRHELSGLASNTDSDISEILHGKNSEFPTCNKHKIVILGDRHARGCDER
jgi:hypothetical protein